MSFKKENVTLGAAKILEGKAVLIQGAAEGPITKITRLNEGNGLPDPAFKYVVEFGGQQFKVKTENEQFEINEDAIIMVGAKGKAELMYDSLLPVDIPSLTFAKLNESGFLGRVPLTELKVVRYSPKFKLFGGGVVKNMKKDMQEGKAGRKADAVILHREFGHYTQVLANRSVPEKLLVLIKDGNDFFVANIKQKIKFSDFEDLFGGAVYTTIGEFVKIVFDPENPSNVVLDYAK